MAITERVELRTIGDRTELAPLGDRIEPVWWTGTPAIDPGLFTIDADGRDLSGVADPDSTELAERMRDTFDRIGLVRLVGTGLTELADMRRWARTVLGEQMVYEGGSNPRDQIEPNVYEVGAPLVAWLHYHHEMAYIGRSNRRLAFMCRHATPGKGHTFVSDNVSVTEAILETDLGRKLKELGVCYHRNLTDAVAFEGREELGVYNHWQRSLGTDDPAEAEARAQARGLATDWGPGRFLKTKFYVSAFEYFPQLGRNLLYSSVADHSMWFDAWPLVQHLPHDQRPLDLTFGDDSPFSREELVEFVEVYGRFGIPIEWNVGDLAVVCNYRFAHGRPEIHLAGGEQRTLGVLLGEEFDRLGDLPDGW